MAVEHRVPGQSQKTVDGNISWFQDNAAYVADQASLEHYRYIELMVARELSGQGHVLDVGNGGFTNYDTELAEWITAVDLFLEDGPGLTANSTHKRGSILELPFPDEAFDCVLLQNVFHHVIGVTIAENHQNLSKGISEIARCVRVGGKVIIIESTVGDWFYNVEKLLFRPLLALKKGGHPVTFQYTPRQIIDEALSSGLEIVEYADVPTRGLEILQFGRRWPTMLTPARPIKLILTKK